MLRAFLPFFDLLSRQRKNDRTSAAAATPAGGQGAAGPQPGLPVARAAGRLLSLAHPAQARLGLAAAAPRLRSQAAAQSAAAQPAHGRPLRPQHGIGRDLRGLGEGAPRPASAAAGATAAGAPALLSHARRGCRQLHAPHGLRRHARADVSSTLGADAWRGGRQRLQP